MKEREVSNPVYADHRLAIVPTRDSRVGEGISVCAHFVLIKDAVRAVCGLVI